MRLFDMSLERRELLAPHYLGDLKPSHQIDHRLRPQGIYPHPGIKGGVRFLNQAALTQDTQVSAHRRRGELERPGKLTGRPGPVSQQFYHSAPVWISQGGESSVEDANVRQLPTSLPVKCGGIRSSQ